jgi:hypothetical protein
MPALPTDAAVTACKRQIDVALAIAEAVVEAAEKAREIQLAAAVDAHAALEATRKSLESATTLPELVELQSRFITGNLGKMIAYWTSLAGNARDTQVRIAAILGGGAEGALPPDLLRGMYALPAIAEAALKSAQKAA